METNRNMELASFQSRKLNPTTTWLLFIFLGWSYGSMNQIGKQILFYVTCGGLGMWTFYRLFTLNNKIKEYNKQIAVECGLTLDEMRMLGVL